MSFSEKIREDMLDAVKQSDSAKVEVLKISIASLKNAEIDKGESLTDSEQEQILRKEVKKLKDASDQYLRAGREDLAQKEKIQLEILEFYLPKLMSEDEIRVIVEKKLNELGVDSPRDMGKAMGSIMQELTGKADGNIVSAIVKEVLNEG